MDTSRCGSIGQTALGLLVALCALGGCVREARMTIDPTALPNLSKSHARYPKGWHFTRDMEGHGVELQGPITGVEVRVWSEKDPGKVIKEAFHAPFQAEFTAPGELTVTDVSRGVAFSRSWVQGAVVYYRDYGNRAKQRVGLPLIAAGVLPLVLGIIIFQMTRCASGEVCADREVSDNEEFVGNFFGSFFTIAGGGLLVPGIVLVSVDAAIDHTNPRQRPSTSLRVQPVPGGVVLQGAF